ncbi:hypothetical protein HELRODRAFT_160134 [Helobdella robusta]|uniref:Uncharacterized protein n=1 Tax=Helobdella robusta TaxID=6412 RepID=T1EPU9_HELRO|nr:hypothetical protein HELRODRAFT_160134 [Helobdella robusta]ESO06022.1 hypothetical protein HELRODRAFT_160134 [Helobdella robusta]
MAQNQASSRGLLQVLPFSFIFLVPYSSRTLATIDRHKTRSLTLVRVEMCVKNMATPNARGAQKRKACTNKEIEIKNVIGKCQKFSDFFHVTTFDDKKVLDQCDKKD